MLPYLLPSIVVALVFQWLLSPGVRRRQPGPDADRRGRAARSTSSAAWAPRCGRSSAWRAGSTARFATLLILARLQAINPKLYEAAARLGRRARSARFWDVTLPNLRTTLIVIALLRGIWMFNKFDSIWLVTHGGPLKHDRDAAALRLPPGLRGVRLRPGRGGLHGDVRGAAGGRGRLLQAVRPHARDRGGPVSRLLGLRAVRAAAGGAGGRGLPVLLDAAHLVHARARRSSGRPTSSSASTSRSSNYRELLFATEFARYFVEQPDRGGGRHRAERGRGHAGRLRPHALRLPGQEDASPSARSSPTCSRPC